MGWGQAELAAAASVSLSTVRDYEKGRHTPIANNLAAIRAALEAQGFSLVNDGETSGLMYRKR